MIEIKISTSTAVALLTERMNFELELREKAGSVPPGLDIKDLGYQELLKLAEVAAFDLVFLLPAEVLMDNNNLADIICMAIQSLSNVFSREEFKTYSKNSAQQLLAPIKKIFKKATDKSIFLKN